MRVLVVVLLVAALVGCGEIGESNTDRQQIKSFVKGKVWKVRVQAGNRIVPISGIVIDNFELHESRIRPQVVADGYDKMIICWKPLTGGVRCTSHTVEYWLE